MKYAFPHGLTFGFSALVAEKMALSSFITRPPIANSASFLVTRCPYSTVAQLNSDGVCFCGIQSMSIGRGNQCDGNQFSDRNTVCVEDLRYGLSKRHATCGLEFTGRKPGSSSCPVGYEKLPGIKGTCICQDSASVHSCGPEQANCMGLPGALRTECHEAKCRVLMCKEGWRFKSVSIDDTSCLPSKPMFFTS